jgi:hypothetical protein
VTPAKAQRLGATSAVVVVLAVGTWVRTRPPPCHGSLTVELRPPLWKEGVYHFELEFDAGAPPCVFDVALGVPDPAESSHCPYTRQLRQRKVGEVTSIVGFTLSESPSTLRLKIRHEQDWVYDTRVEPRYDASNIETGQFCGASAFVSPVCLAGSKFCKPFAASCTSAADCGSGQICCVSASWGLEHGSFAASQCTSRHECDGRIDTSIACRSDAECDADRACRASKAGEEFRPEVNTCELRSRAESAR